MSNGPFDNVCWQWTFSHGCLRISAGQGSLGSFKCTYFVQTCCIFPLYLPFIMHAITYPFSYVCFMNWLFTCCVQIYVTASATLTVWECVPSLSQTLQHTGHEYDQPALGEFKFYKAVCLCFSNCRFVAVLFYMYFFLFFFGTRDIYIMEFYSSCWLWVCCIMHPAMDYLIEQKCRIVIRVCYLKTAEWTMQKNYWECKLCSVLNIQGACMWPSG